VSLEWQWCDVMISWLVTVGLVRSNGSSLQDLWLVFCNKLFSNNFMIHNVVKRLLLICVQAAFWQLLIKTMMMMMMMMMMMPRNWDHLVPNSWYILEYLHNLSWYAVILHVCVMCRVCQMCWPLISSLRVKLSLIFASLKSRRKNGRSSGNLLMLLWVFCPTCKICQLFLNHV